MKPKRCETINSNHRHQNIIIMEVTTYTNYWYCIVSSQRCDFSLSHNSFSNFLFIAAMSSTIKKKPVRSTASRQHVQYKSLASYLKYLEGEELTVELKNGKQCAGILVRAEEPSMNLTLQNMNNPNSSNNNDDGGTTNQANNTSSTNNKLTHIRGAAIRYIHFGDDYMECIRAAQDREQSALQKYRRGLRK
jgi:small nuclear ribonucleoprotein (snRNP)-like protein